MNIDKPTEVITKGNDIKGMYWSFVLYPKEDLDHKKIFDLLTQNCVTDIRYILHDKDMYRVPEGGVDEHGHYDGQIKKEHWHFLYKTECRISIDKVSALIHLPTHAIERVNSVAVKAQYLLHADVQSLFDDYKYKYPKWALSGALPLNPNKWDEDYLWQYWSLYIKNTNLGWGDIVYRIGSSGQYKWLNKYRTLLYDIYSSSHYREISVYENEKEKER